MYAQAADMAGGVSMFSEEILEAVESPLTEHRLFGVSWTKRIMARKGGLTGHSEDKDGFPCRKKLVRRQRAKSDGGKGLSVEAKVI